jgi:hypothetical protein
MSPRRIMWGGTAAIELSVIVLGWLADAPWLALGLNLGFLFGISLLAWAVVEDRKRQP